MATQPIKPSYMVFGLFFSMVFAVRFLTLAPTASGYFVRIDHSSSTKGQPWVVLRDARGHESSVSTGTRFLAGVRPGDPLHKSPGNDDIRPWPKGEPFPEPAWFRFGYESILMDAVVMLIAGASCINQCLRVSSGSGR